MGLETPLALLVLLPLAYFWWRGGRGVRPVRLIRIAILVICALVLASPFWRMRGSERRVVFLVDRSLSAGEEALRAAAEMLKFAQHGKDASDRIDVVTFGDGASVLLNAANMPSEVGAAALEDASDLHAGLSLAASLCSGGGGRVLVISDGLYTGPDPTELAPELHKTGTEVDYWPIRRDHPRDVAISRIDLPERVRSGHPFEVTLSIISPVAAKVVVRVETAETRLDQEVALRAGENRLAFRHVLARPGLARLVVTVVAPDDKCPENNRAVAVTEVAGPSQILVLNRSGRPDNVTEALRTAGMQVQVAGPGWPVTSAGLKGFAAVVLENIPLSMLNDRADAALRHYATELGGGLLIAGGENSFAAGGYYLSRLDPVLPVSMERKDEFRRSQLAMAIVLDRSGSMSIPVPGGPQKIQLADRAAAEAVSLLAPEDEIAVFAIDSEAHRIVGLSKVAQNTARIKKAILSIESMGGGIYVYTGLRAAAAELAASKAPSRHIVLFADANDSEEPGDYQKLVGAWAAAGFTMTVIGLGTDHDQDAAFLKDVAARAKGPIVFTEDARSLPRIFCEDAIRVARKTFIKAETATRVAPNLAQVGELKIDAFPPVGGYNLCYTRDEAAEMIVTTDENKAPVLAAWRRGIGKVAALTCELDGPYTGKLAAWPQYKPFLSSLAKWLERAADDPGCFGTIVREGRSATVILEMDDPSAQKCTGARAVIIPPDESDPVQIPLQWTSPQTMQAAFRLRQNGIYHGMILTREGRRVSLPPVVLPYSPEFEPSPPGAGLDLLARLAESTGGVQVLHAGDLFARGSATAGDSTARSLAPLAAALVLVLLITDIITRRALWPVLVPAFLKRTYGLVREETGRQVVVLAERVRRLRARRITRAEQTPGVPDEPPQPGPETPPPAAPAGPGPSAFDRAKRRSRL